MTRDICESSSCCRWNSDDNSCWSAIATNPCYHGAEQAVGLTDDFNDDDDDYNDDEDDQEAVKEVLDQFGTCEVQCLSKYNSCEEQCANCYNTPACQSFGYASEAQCEADWCAYSDDEYDDEELDESLAAAAVTPVAMVTVEDWVMYGFASVGAGFLLLQAATFVINKRHEEFTPINGQDDM